MTSCRKDKVKVWIEAMRLRTLPVSVAGVLGGTACAFMSHSFRWIPALICLVFAVLAQIVSNFANEYYDFKNGLDKKGREGFRRGVTEGDISPTAMKKATFWLLAADCIIGCSLIYFGGWWLIAVGITIAAFALAYSTGPYPLSHHGLGDIAVIFFFGIIPVTLTCLLQTGHIYWSSPVVTVSVAIGLMSANVLVVNNYRDIDDDRAVGKRTTAVIFGRKTMATAYLISGIIAIILFLVPVYLVLGPMAVFPVIIYFPFHFFIWRKLRRSSGISLNPLLGMTAVNLLVFCLIFLTVSIIYSL